MDLILIQIGIYSVKYYYLLLQLNKQYIFTVLNFQSSYSGECLENFYPHVALIKKVTS